MGYSVSLGQRTILAMNMMTGEGRRVSSVADLAQAVRRAWSRDTSFDPAGWSTDSPSWGHCAVTALIVQDLFGGDLVRGWVEATVHYWNRLPTGEEIDLTVEQFGEAPKRDDARVESRDYVLSFPDTRARYERLLGRLLDLLEQTWIRRTAELQSASGSPAGLQSQL